MLNSKEALEILSDWANGKTKLTFTQNCELYNIVLQDLDKLEQYKQLERELGINLFILFGALRNGIYYKSFNGDIDYLSKRVLTLSYSFGFDIWVEGHKKFDGLLIDFKYYGKTWSLRKEDLEDDK